MKSTVVEPAVTALDSLLKKVYRDGGHDFRLYKRGTVTRRLERRLHATGASSYRDYINFLDNRPEEYQNLVSELSINVSGFFRNQYTFEQLNRLVLPELLANKRRVAKPRFSVWSNACASGEEPYSIAIQLLEFLGSERRDFKTTVYATDISHTALRQARAGIYSSKEIEVLPTAIRERYFRRHDQAYTVRDSLKRILRFSHFDLTFSGKIPFSGLDVIFCCNVLIYMQAQLQERVLTRLYHSLATPGYLILGEVETPPPSLREKLECLDSKAKIYKKNGTSDHV